MVPGGGAAASTPPSPAARAPMGEWIKGWMGGKKTRGLQLWGGPRLQVLLTRLALAWAALL